MRAKPRFIAIVFCLIVAGCGGVKAPSLGNHLKEQTATREGHVFLVRGLLGVFSTGMDDLRDTLRRQGVRAVAFQHTDEHSAARLIADHVDLRESPLIIVGHSLGADAAVKLCELLRKQNVTVDLLITLDPIRPDHVPTNVRQAINYYRSDGVLYPLPLFQGVPLHPDEAGYSVLRNVDLNAQPAIRKGTNHFNIDTSRKLQDEIVKRVLALCPPVETHADIAGGELRNGNQEARTNQ